MKKKTILDKLVLLLDMLYLIHIHMVKNGNLNIFPDNILQTEAVQYIYKECHLSGICVVITIAMLSCSHVYLLLLRYSLINVYCSVQRGFLC